MSTASRRGRRGAGIVRDRHLLYSAAVQSVEADLDFFERIYRKRHGRRFEALREDFCGTAALACEWVRRRPTNKAWGLDLHRPTLDWGRARYVPRLGAAAERLTLLERDVLDAHEPRADVVAALNFSYCIFKDRATLRRYFRSVHRSLRPGGVLILDLFGGTEAICEDREDRRIPASTAFDGSRVPAFTYVWEQAAYNVIDNGIVCHIHFKLRDGTRIRRAFSYDWRLWTIPELRELLDEAGFTESEVYLEGWDDEEDDTDGVFRRRTRFDNQSGWVAYVVGYSKSR